ncbi:sulfurtransferase [Salinibacterium sp. G-O1]|uniref:sulfurtransferase n=1 Tax=Salinibacterium sp. G-O1 TaxID=3046208 RepID=UPI0024BA83D8|nr:sulfurtransferase [Salinibacterium sp. G-O1]MDJ0336199.1 sulfurtransferase [Salinibacterium sp. G-O1]
MSHLISAEALAAELASPIPPVVLDVRWVLGRTDGREHYLAGHVPGAVFVDLDHELAGHGRAEDGRHPLPAIDDLQAAARRWGISADSAVVIYDDLKSMAAARAWWLLRWAGCDNVRVLDGALPAWVATGRILDEGDVVPDAGTVVLEPGNLPVLTIDETAAFPGHGVLLDARAPERFRGDVEPMDPRAGHIPGAVNAPSTGNVDSDGRFLPADALAARYESLGVAAGIPVGAYCGSGITAAHDVLALAIAGVDAALFPGSWSSWSNHPDRPVAVG